MANLLKRSDVTLPTTGSAAGWDPWRMMEQMLHFDPLRDLAANRFAPSVEIKETKDGYRLRADLPGVREEDVDVSLTGNQLSISGKREEEKRDEGDRYFTYERSYGSFSRSFQLPQDADLEHLEADMKDGVLTVSIAKRPELQPRKIPLKERVKQALKT